MSKIFKKDLEFTFTEENVMVQMEMTILMP